MEQVKRSVKPKSVLKNVLLGATIILCASTASSRVSAEGNPSPVSNQLSAGVQQFSYILGDDYPAYLKSAAPDSLVDPWRLYNRECVSFVAHRLSSVNGFTIPGAYGNADAWGSRAKREGYVVDKNPVVGAVAWWSAGHVAWVAEVSGDMVTIEEYNYAYTHQYHRRTIKTSQVDGFIHFKDIKSSGIVMAAVNGLSSSQSTRLAASGTYTFSESSPIRGEAKLSSPALATYAPGQSVNYDRLVEAEGYRWISYISYSGLRRYIAVESLAKPTRGTLVVVNQNDSSGTFDVVISNVSHPNLKDVEVPIWSANNGQDDIVWYKGQKQSDGTYKVQIDISNHKNDRGVYYLHLYYLATDDSRTFVEGNAKTITVSDLSTQATDSKAPAQPNLPAQGSYTFSKSSPIRNEPKESSPTIGTYDSGERVNYDKLVTAENKLWISYVSYSGVRRYIAIS